MPRVATLTGLVIVTVGVAGGALSTVNVTAVVRCSFCGSNASKLAVNGLAVWDSGDDGVNFTVLWSAENDVVPATLVFVLSVTTSFVVVVFSTSLNVPLTTAGGCTVVPFAGDVLTSASTMVSFVAVSVASTPVLPAGSVECTVAVSVPSVSPATLGNVIVYAPPAPAVAVPGIAAVAASVSFSDAVTVAPATPVLPV